MRSPPVTTEVCRPGYPVHGRSVCHDSSQLIFREENMRKAAFRQCAYLWLLTTAIFVGVGGAVTSSARAQDAEPDHLKCYEVVKDTNPKDKVIVDLITQLGEEQGCKLATKA